MKRIYFLLIVTCIGSLSFSQSKKLHFKKGINSDKKESLLPSRSVSENKNYIEINYNFEDAGVINIKQDTDQFQLIRVKGFGIMGDVGKPALPCYNDILVVPQKEGLKINILEANYQEYDNYYIQPALEPQIDSEKTDTKIKIDKSTYSSNLYFPKDIVEISSVQIYRDIPLAFVQIRPIQFNPKTKKIRCYSNIKYQIVFDGSKPKRKINDKKDALAILRNTVSNPESIETYTAPPSPKLRSASIAESSTSRDYIIITTNEFLPAAREFADWKTLLGFSCEVVSQASWDTAQVRNAIYTRYHNWNPKPEYFLIIGDQEDVPGKIFNYVDYGNYATDLYYACMDGNDDYRPDMAHGRVSVSSLEEAYLVLRKMANYEQNPIDDDSFYQTAVHCAYFEDGGYLNRIMHDGYEDRRFICTSEDLRDYLTDSLPIFERKTVNRVLTYTMVIDSITNKDLFCPRYYSPYYSDMRPIQSELRKDTTPYYPWKGKTSDITREINSGTFYVLYNGHGTYDHWQSPSFSINDINNLSNADKLPVVFSITCQTGGFLQDECFAEKLIRHPGGGAVGVFAASQVGYCGQSDALALGMFDAIWSKPGLLPYLGVNRKLVPDTTSHSDIFKMGYVLNQGLSRMSQTYYSYGDQEEYIHKIFHYFGDPSMELYTAKPSTFSNVIVSENGSSVTVNVGIDSCKITICSMPDMGKSYHAVADMVSSYTFTDISKPYCISITKHNFKPYFYPCPDIYIQNHTFTSDSLLVGRSIFAGNAVTETQTQGAVTIENGANVILRAEQNVLLDCGFETKLGGTLEIEKE